MTLRDILDTVRRVEVRTNRLVNDMMVGAYLGGRNGMTIALAVAVCTNAFAYFFSDKIALKSSGAQPVTREQLPRLYAVMERLAAKANIPVPKLYVVPEQAPNAFATGRIRITRLLR